MTLRNFFTCPRQANLWCRHERDKAVQDFLGNVYYHFILLYIIQFNMSLMDIIIPLSPCRELLLHILLWYLWKSFQEMHKPRSLPQGGSLYSSCTVSIDKYVFLCLFLLQTAIVYTLFLYTRVICTINIKYYVNNLYNLYIGIMYNF